jgi:small conductance mechanosensitive channel
MSFWQENRDYFLDAIVVVVVLAAAWLLYKLIKRGINRFSRSRNLPETDPGAYTRFRMIQRLSAVVLFFVALGVIFWLIDSARLNHLATAMFATGGIVGIAIAFAAQTTIANLVSGVIIAFAQPIRLGDQVFLDDEYGTVESIGLFYTRIRVWDNRRLVIPNKLLSDRTIRNYTVVDPRMPALVALRLVYGSDVEAVRRLLLELARAHRLFMPEPEPVVQVIDADDRGITVRLIAWAPTQPDAFTMSVELREAALARLEGIATPVGLRWAEAIGERRDI